MGMNITPGKNTLLWVFKITVISAVIILFLVMAYVLLAVHEVQLQIEATSIQKTSIDQAPSTIEAGTSVYSHVLEDYLLYSVSQTEEPLDINDPLIIEKRNNNYFVKEKLELPPLMENSCALYRCVQHRKKFTEIPASIWKALLGTEDFRFLEHRGVDPVAIARAIVVDIIAMKFVQGGSTLTQQLVKNLFLTNEKKLSRKGKELVYALYIENVLTKEEIVTLYLNEVFWGVYQGVQLKGFYAASLAYFNKTPQELDEFEATVLVSFLKGPNFYHPVRGLERMKNRAHAVYNRLIDINLFSENQSLVWNEERWMKWSDDFKQRNQQNTFYSYYLASKNSDQLIDSFDKMTLYESVEKIEEFLAPRTKGADVGIKIFIADKDCNEFNCPQVFSYYSKFERDKNKAMTGEFHQVGSLFKPMVYESFIELGRDYNEYISTAPLTLNLKSGKWTPKDYSRASESEVQLKVALQKSKNIPLIRVANEIGFQKLEQALVHKIPRLKTPLEEFPAQLLGALELSMEEVFVTYSNFIQNKCLEIKNKDKEFENSVLYYMSVASETTISKIARAPLKYANIFGKTGTSNNGLDNWYFAFDGRNYYVLWFGVESERDKQNLARVSGAVSSFLIFQNFINHRGKQISEIICD
ncbi:MAG: hypothetical protein CME62_16950 [Halobacteriovoraceae bacterium]|nr:hypothetical protein [Halobacteriovoraceae bacterium]